eukprot:Hpha_TRINITY_DN15370_c1_g4::TRINITY_DN15370_c1_g4_i1::g.87375::m.87375
MLLSISSVICGGLVVCGVLLLINEVRGTSLLKCSRALDKLEKAAAAHINYAAIMLADGKIEQAAQEEEAAASVLSHAVITDSKKLMSRRVDAMLVAAEAHRQVAARIRKEPRQGVAIMH